MGISINKKNKLPYCTECLAFLSTIETDLPGVDKEGLEHRLKEHSTLAWTAHLFGLLSAGPPITIKSVFDERFGTLSRERFAQPDPFTVRMPTHQRCSGVQSKGCEHPIPACARNFTVSPDAPMSA